MVEMVGKKDKYLGTMVAAFNEHEYIMTFENGCYCFYQHLEPSRNEKAERLAEENRKFLALTRRPKLEVVG